MHARPCGHRPQHWQPNQLLLHVGRAQGSEGLRWIRKGEALSTATITFSFNQDPERVRHAERADDTSDIRDWFNGDRTLSITEQVMGLGNYGKTLTVLTALDIEEQIEEIEEMRPWLNRGDQDFGAES